MDIDTSSRVEQRKFGMVMAVAVAALAGIRWGLHWVRQGEPGNPPWCFLAVAAAFLILGVAAPGLLRPVLVVWMRLAKALNWVMTHLILTIAFFLLILPTRLILVLVRHDPLNRAWRPDAETYWETAEEQPDEIEAYKKQF